MSSVDDPWDIRRLFTCHGVISRRSTWPDEQFDHEQQSIPPGQRGLHPSPVVRTDMIRYITAESIFRKDANWTFQTRNICFLQSHAFLIKMLQAPTWQYYVHCGTGTELCTGSVCCDRRGGSRRGCSPLFARTTEGGHPFNPIIRPGSTCTTTGRTKFANVPTGLIKVHRCGVWTIVCWLPKPKSNFPNFKVTSEICLLHTPLRPDHN